MVEWIAIAVSTLALTVSAATAWRTLFRSGELRMTRPTLVYFGPDGGRRNGEKPRVKVFLRTLLYSTARLGQIVESMYVHLQCGESKQNFSFWVYGDDFFAPGSGLYVGHEGIACNHRFLQPENSADFPLLPGQYNLRVFAKRVSGRTPLELAHFILDILDSLSKELQGNEAGIYFVWVPDQQAYHAHVEVKESRPLPPWQLEVEAGR